MGTVYIQEYEQMGRDPSGSLVPVGKEPAIAKQTITTDAVSSAQSAQLQPSTAFVRIVASADCHLEFGIDPTATTASMAIEGSQAEYFGVRKGLKIAAIEGVL